MKLSGPEQQMVVELMRNPVFGGLMQRISEENPVPKWRKGGDEKAKHHEWIYRSGFVEGINYVLKLLRYENE